MVPFLNQIKRISINPHCCCGREIMKRQRKEELKKKNTAFVLCEVQINEFLISFQAIMCEHLMDICAF